MYYIELFRNEIETHKKRINVKKQIIQHCLKNLSKVLKEARNYLNNDNYKIEISLVRYNNNDETEIFVCINDSLTSKKCSKMHKRSLKVIYDDSLPKSKIIIENELENVEIIKGFYNDLDNDDFMEKIIKRVAIYINSERRHPTILLEGE